MNNKLYDYRTFNIILSDYSIFHGYRITLGYTDFAYGLPDLPNEYLEILKNDFNFKMERNLFHCKDEETAIKAVDYLNSVLVAKKLGEYI